MALWGVWDVEVNKKKNSFILLAFDENPILMLVGTMILITSINV